MSLQVFAGILSANLGIAYLSIFIILFMVEIFLGQPQLPAAASPRRGLVNFGMLALTVLMSALVRFSAISAAALVERGHFGLFQQVAAPAAVILLVAVLTQTGLSYALHRLSHAVPLLWRLHRCHHSDPHFDLSLALRHHPLEALPGLIVTTLGIVAMGLPVWAVAVVQLMLMGANCFEHLAITLPEATNRRLSKMLVTPAVHHLHHSVDQGQTDSNFGSFLTLWDRLFGTFNDPAISPVARIGLGDDDDRLADNFLAQLMLPFASGTGRRVQPGQRAPQTVMSP